MPARFFGIFLGLIAAILIIGGIFINMISGEASVVEYWILLLLPCFSIPILSAVCLKEID
ncbi:hypothetical protein HX122_00545 [Acinetobacter towneri]|uniref:hypothetical protein n=1 Tax=Acinetobacter towneri TaxID=202956 RepID=UPI0025760A9D|nr:hypothetical protein [Acinetobacter towneri]MDM1753513.1 hypothetical protein [Acinetobacter towneri]